MHDPNMTITKKVAPFRQILTDFWSENNFELRKGYRIRFIKKIPSSEKKNFMHHPNMTITKK